jgi:hypothetical protein
MLWTLPKRLLRPVQSFVHCYEFYFKIYEEMELNTQKQVLDLGYGLRALTLLEDIVCPARLESCVLFTHTHHRLRRPSADKVCSEQNSYLPVPLAPSSRRSLSWLLLETLEVGLDVHDT